MIVVCVLGVFVCPIEAGEDPPSKGEQLYIYTPLRVCTGRVTLTKAV